MSKITAFDSVHIGAELRRLRTQQQPRLTTGAWMRKAYDGRLLDKYRIEGMPAIIKMQRCTEPIAVLETMGEDTLSVPETVTKRVLQIQCRRCKEKRDIIEFSPDRRKVNGVQSYCLLCRRQIERERYHRRKSA